MQLGGGFFFYVVVDEELHRGCQGRRDGAAPITRSTIASAASASPSSLLRLLDFFAHVNSRIRSTALVFHCAGVIVSPALIKETPARQLKVDRFVRVSSAR